ncbi:hypothetical protein BJY00DRAFT_247146 [Aspergillus carlsbadensis]|nr:hypothetical protein BJY00DRAFT_247146 [Aspergillus carlsbadensis]
MDASTTVKRFMSDQAPKYHEAFGVTSTYDDQRGEFSARHPHSDLKEALQNCAETWNINCDVKTCTWGDVFDEMQAAEDEYHRRGTGKKNLPRRSMRWAGDNAADINPWFDMFPSEFGGNILTAGLKLVFSIAKQQADMRTKILAAFRTIVDIIIDTRATREQFRSSADLRKPALELYDTVLCTIQKLATRLNGKHSTNKVFQKVFRPALTAGELDEVLGSMDRKVNAYQKCLQSILNATLSRIDSSTRSISSESRMTRAVVTDTKLDVRDIKQTVGTISDENKHISAFLKQLQVEYQSVEERRELGSNAQTAFCRTLMDEINTVKALLSASPTQTVYIQDDRPSKSFLPGELLARVIDVHHLSPLNDLDYVLREGNSSDNASQAQTQAQQLIHQPRFHQWLTSARSDLLLVLRDFDICSRMIPLSYLCAHLSLSLSNTPGYIILHFFCGQHESRADPLRGPQGLLRSLITQLLHTAGPFNHNFIETRDYAERIESHIVRDLCVTFKALITQLPLNQRVFCFIENILWLESPEWMQELIDVLEILYRMTHDEHLHPILKVLITSGSARCGVERAIPAQNQVLLTSDDVDHGYGQMSERTVLSDLHSLRERGAEQKSLIVEYPSEESEEEEYLLLD